MFTLNKDPILNNFLKIVILNLMDTNREQIVERPSQQHSLLRKPAPVKDR